MLNIMALLVFFLWGWINVVEGMDLEDWATVAVILANVSVMARNVFKAIRKKDSDHGKKL